MLMGVQRHWHEHQQAELLQNVVLCNEAGQLCDLAPPFLFDIHLFARFVHDATPTDLLMWMSGSSDMGT